MEFLILGPIEARRDGKPVPLGGPKQRGVLAILLTRPGEVVPTERLIADLWGGSPPPNATGTLHGYVSQLRKALGPDVLVTRAPGYLVRASPDELDLRRFERLVDAGSRELAAGRPDAAASTLAEALRLWRGPALADFAYERFAQAEIARLEELRLVALERRVEADLALGRHAELVAELQTLTASHPFRERPRGQLMLALYRSGRQAEALEAYREARRALVEELGIEPSQALQELERAILRQEPALSPPVGRAEPAVSAPSRTDTFAAERAILVAPLDGAAAGALVALAERLCRRPPREVIVVALVDDEAALPGASALAEEQRAGLIARGVPARAGAFTSAERGEDLVLLATEQDVDLLLVDAPEGLVRDGTPDRASAMVLDRMPCDVGVLAVRPEQASAGIDPERPVLVPFGGDEHEWAAVEIGAWVASAYGSRLRLLGTAADPALGRRDASRLLARAALLVQKVTGVVTEPLLVPPGERAVLEAAEGAGLVALGLGSRWRQEGLGTSRLAVLQRARPPVLLVRSGLRPGGLAPAESLTRFTWTLAGSGRDG